MKKILGIVLTVVLLGCGAPDNGLSNTFDEGDAYDRVISSGVLNVGFVSYPPSFVIDPNSGKYSGISNDILEQAADKLGLRINYAAEVGWGDMIEAIRSKKIDVVITGVWPTAARGKYADFSIPLFYSTVNAYVAEDDVRFDNKNIDLINSGKVTVAAMDGEMSLLIAQSDFPKAKVVSLSQGNSVSELALMVASKKADVTFLEPAIAEEYMAKNPGKIRQVENSRPLRTFPNVYMIGKGEYRLKSTLDSAIGELHNANLVNKIIDRYEEYPGSYLRVK